MNLFLGRALEQPEPKPENDAKFDFVGKREKCKLHYMNCRTIKERDNCLQSTEQRQVCGQSICRAHSHRICKKCLEKQKSDFLKVVNLSFYRFCCVLMY